MHILLRMLVGYLVLAFVLSPLALFTIIYLLFGIDYVIVAAGAMLISIFCFFLGNDILSPPK